MGGAAPGEGAARQATAERCACQPAARHGVGARLPRQPIHVPDQDHQWQAGDGVRAERAAYLGSGHRLERRGVRQLERGCGGGAAHLDFKSRGAGGRPTPGKGKEKRMNHSIRTSCVRGLASLAAFGLLVTLPPAQADDAAVGAAAAAPAPAATESRERAGPQSLQEVVVTATRHEESLSKIPISVTALTQDAMDSRGIKDFQDIARFTPGVSIDNSGTNAISIRGISSSAGAGTTGIYLDDTPIQMRNVGFNPEDTLPKMFDLQRVEILRGPQGTLFGAGAEGGAVRYILTPPSLTNASTYVRSELSYTEYGQPSYEAGIAHGSPIIDGTLGYRASIWYRYDGGWIDRVAASDDAVTAHNVNYSHAMVARVALIYAPSSNFTATPSIIYQNRQEHDQPTYWPAYSNPGAGEFNTATPERIPDPDQYYLPALKLQLDLGK